MKPLPLLLALSVAANMALAFVVVSHRNVSSAKPSAATAPAVAKPSNETTSHAALAEALMAAAKTRDPVQLRDQLRAAGLPDDVIRAAVRALLMKPVADLQKSLTAEMNKGQYWKVPAGAVAFGSLSKEQRAQLREASRAAEKQFESLFGPDPDNPMNARYSFLPAEKASKLRDLERDYDDLRTQVMSDAEGFRTAADEQKVAYLEKEKRKDLAALLSPAELEAYDLRNSQTAARLRFQLRDFNATEDEYKAIYAAQKAYDDRFAQATPMGPGGEMGDGQARQAARQQMLDQMKAALGEDRFNDYLRSQNPEYRQLEAAARRYNLPNTAVSQAYAARDQAVAAAQRITSDTSMNDEQRRQALATLADQTRNQVTSSLGAEAADAYLRNNMRWLDGLKKGQPIVVTPDGSVYTRPAQRGPANVSIAPLPGSGG